MGPNGETNVPQTRGRNQLTENPQNATTALRVQKDAGDVVRRQQKLLLATVNGTLMLEGDYEYEWSLKPAAGNVPEHWTTKIRGFHIHLRDGLEPPANDQPFEISGRIEVKKNTVTKVREGVEETSEYIYLNLFPLPEGGKAEAKVTISKPEKTKGRRKRKVLPRHYNKESDHHTIRQGQPWQVILIRG